MSLFQLKWFCFLILLICSFAVCSDVYAADTDGDGIDDTIDNCPTVFNPTQRNFDGDAFGDACDDDDDNDSVLDVNDNCAYGSNLNQADNDNDSYGDVCDGDDDNDGVLDLTDNCPLKSNPTQKDFDSDGVGDVCDSDDTDSDLIYDGFDNCPTVANFNQSNIDHDEYGDACDEDMDGDFIPNDSDNCPTVYNPDQADTDSDGKGDRCENPAIEDVDGDGFFGAQDTCSYDPNKQASGVCGCGFTDLDADGDGAPICMDLCPGDRLKRAPGACGCNVVERDLNQNGICDTAEAKYKIRGRVYLEKPNGQERNVAGITIRSSVGGAVTDADGEYEAEVIAGSWPLWLSIPESGVYYSKYARKFDFRTVTGREDCPYPVIDDLYSTYSQCDQDPVCSEAQCQSSSVLIDTNYMNNESGDFVLTGVDFILTECQAGRVKDANGNCVELDTASINTIKACRYAISADSDGDGVANDIEYRQGTDPCDRSSMSSNTPEPIYSKYNTFLGQENYLELISSGPKSARVLISVYGPEGKQIGKAKKVILKPGKQFDLSINQLVGKGNSFGMVKVYFAGDDAGTEVSGRVTTYRPESGSGQYSMAFARDLIKAQRGKVYAVANTEDPEGRGSVLENWLEVVNLENKSQKFQIRMYNQEGILVAQNGKQLKGRNKKSSTISIKGRGEVDLQAGHELGEGRYLVEVIPSDLKAQYFVNLARYGARVDKLTQSADIYFGSAIPAGYGRENQFAVVNNLKGECWNQSNWLEIANVSAEKVDTLVTIYGQNGEKRLEKKISLSSFAQEELNAGIVLAKGSFGLAQIQSSSPASVFVDSYVFYTDCQNGQVQTAYVDSALAANDDIQTTSFNTFLGMKNYLKLFNLAAEKTSYVVRYVDQHGSSGASEVANVKMNTSRVLDFSKMLADIYGLVKVTPSATRSFAGQTIRLREVNGAVDFAMPITVK